MRRVLLVLAAIALTLPPAVSLAQSPTADVRKTVKAEEPTRPTGDGAGQMMKDSWLTTKTKVALAKTERTKARHIKVETLGAVVTLRGKVSSAQERAAAEEIARDIDGVASVSNALQIVPEDQRKSVDAKDDGIETAVRERFEKDAQLKDAAIKVRSDNGVVTLRGRIIDPRAKGRASDVARGVSGVRAVRNELAPKG